MDTEPTPKEQIITPFSFAYGGDSMGRLADGRAVFTPFALPGEEIRIQLVEEKRGFARAKLVEILTPSSERIQPLCCHFGDCGGCHYQHLSYSGQLDAKTEIVRDQLARLAGIEKPVVQPMIASPAQTHYRNHVQFHLTREGSLGFHRVISNSVLPIQECHLPDPLLNDLWPRLSFEPGQAITRVAVRAGLDDDVQLILESPESLPPEFLVEDLSLSAVHLSPAGSLVLAGSPSLPMRVLDKTFQVSAGSFFQVNTAVAGAIVNHLLETIPSYHPLGEQTTLLDVYSGVGLFSAFFADKVGRIVAIEASPSATVDYAANLDAYDSVDLYEATTAQVLPYLDIKADIALLDPPRAGLDRATLDGLLRLSPALIAYVSCDPATLSRDAKRLTAAGYQLVQVTPFDMFPQTYHIECVMLMIKTQD